MTSLRPRRPAQAPRLSRRPESSRARILLSYRQEDTGGYAPGLYFLLEGHFGKDSVSWEPGTMGGLAKRSSRQLSKQIESLEVVVVLIGGGWLSATDSDGRRRLDDPDDPHRRELEAAVEHDVPLMLLLVDGAQMPGSDDLPPSLARLPEFQAHPLRHERYVADVEDLFQSIERVLWAGAERRAEEARQETERDTRELELLDLAYQRAERGEFETAGQTAALIEDADRRTEALSSIAEQQQELTETKRPPQQVPLPEVLRSAGLRYSEVGDVMALPYWPQRADRLSVTATVVPDEDVAAFAVDLPNLPKLGKEGVAENLLRVTYEADYVKAVESGPGELRLTAEVPRQVLTPAVARGLIDGLSRLGDVASGDLRSEPRWRERLEEGRAAQGLHIRVDEDKTRQAIRELLARAHLKADEIEPGVFGTRLKFAETDDHYPVAIQSTSRAVSLIAYTPLGVKGDRTAIMRRLLVLNGVADVAKVGLDRSGEIALLYEVPAVYPRLIEDVRVQFSLLLLGVLVLKAGP